MTDSVDFEGNAVIERRAQDYYLSPNGLVNVPVKNYSFLVGAGSVYGTARDVFRFGEAVLDGKYGETAKTSLVGEKTLSGSGSTNGHRAYFEIARDKKYGFVVVSNSAGRLRHDYAGSDRDSSRQRRYGEEFYDSERDPNPNKDLGEFLGNYKRNDGSTTDVIRQAAVTCTRATSNSTRSGPTAFLNTGSLVKPVLCAMRVGRSRS